MIIFLRATRFWKRLLVVGTLIARLLVTIGYWIATGIFGHFYPTWYKLTGWAALRRQGRSKSSYLMYRISSELVAIV